MLIFFLGEDITGGNIESLLFNTKKELPDHKEIIVVKNPEIDTGLKVKGVKVIDHSQFSPYNPDLKPCTIISNNSKDTELIPILKTIHQSGTAFRVFRINLENNKFIKLW